MITVTSSDNYADIYGNRIDGKLRNCKVIFKGQNANLELGDGFNSLGNNNTIILENNSKIVFGKNFQMGSNNTFYCRHDSQFKIGNNGVITNYFRLYNRGVVVLGSNFGIRDFGEIRVLGSLQCNDWVYFQHHVSIYAPKKTRIIFGNDSGGSWYTKFIAGGGHSLYDLRHEMKIEDFRYGEDNLTSLEIGNHVWIGAGSTINSGVIIGSGSVVAANSNVVSGIFNEEVLIGGNPAKLIAKGITWDRRIELGYNEFIEYKKKGELLIERAVFLEEYSDKDLDEEFFIKLE